MATPFKLKSGNTSSFKNMGSSPVKQTDPLDLGLADEAKKFDKGYQATKSMPKDFNMSGKDTWTKRSKEILSKGKKVTKKYPGQELSEKLSKAVNKNLAPKAPKKIVRKLKQEVQWGNLNIKNKDGKRIK